MRSIGSVLDDNGGLGKGFDFMRIALSLAVVTWHAAQISKDATELVGPGVLWIAYYSILVMFFGLSGFLIAASAKRLSLKNFLINRGLRIFPALAVEVILSAMVLGPIFTEYSLGEYFTNHKFYLYLTNLLGFVYYYLPGVFNGGWVNGSIWTVPYEIGCYVIISILIYTKSLSRPSILITASVIFLSAQAAMYLYGYRGQPTVAHNPSEAIGLLPQNAISYVFYAPGTKLITSFMVGIAVYLYRYKIPYSSWALCATLLFMVVSEYFGQWVGDINPIANVFLIVPAVYITIRLGISNIPTPPLFRRGDYSYGIYLYGFPFTQATKEVFPQYSQNWVLLVFMCMVPTALFAAASWHYIEKPILQLRKKFSFVALERLAPNDKA